MGNVWDQTILTAVPEASGHPQSGREKPAGAGAGAGSRSGGGRRVENCCPFSTAFKQLDF